MGNNSFMVQQSTSPHKCITYNKLNQKIMAAECNSTDPLQKWIWTRHEQLYHVETSKCIQQGQRQKSRTLLTWYLGLQECNMSETKQKWQCFGNFIKKSIIDDQSRTRIVYVTFESTDMLKLAETTTNWRRYGVDQKVCFLGTYVLIICLS